MAKSNYDLLVDAGIIPDDCRDQFSSDDLTCIEDLSDAEVAEQAMAERCRDLPWLVKKLDVTQEDEAISIVSTAEERFGRVDILVNNAAILDMTTFDELSMDVTRLPGQPVPGPSS